jgi:hypothetical protein
MGINCSKVLEAKSQLRPKARRILEDIANNADLALDERVLAWAKLKAWGYGQDLACCRVLDLQAPWGNVQWRKKLEPLSIG